MPQKLTLLINCPDQKGIVSAISAFVAEHGANIIDSQQHSLGLDARFFMRLEIDTTGSSLTQEELQKAFQPIADKYDIDFSFKYGIKKMAILVSKYDHCLYDILLRQQYGELQVEIPIIISNHPDLEPVAKHFGIEFEHCPINGSKQEQEKQIISCLQKHQVDFVALARYMQILSADFIAHYPHKIINVHHGFLPAFKGAKPYHQAYEKGVKIIGATAHYATEDLDMGPIISQDVIEVANRDSVEDYISKGRDIEKTVFAKAIKAQAESKIILHDSRTIIFD